MSALTLPGIEVGVWQKRHKSDPAARALADRHYSRRRPGTNQIGPPGRCLVLVSPDEQAVWVTHWPYAELALDGLDAWRCTIFRNEGEGLSSELIRAAMETTRALWAGTPADGWITWVDPAAVRSTNPGYCFQAAGWRRDDEWAGAKKRGLVRFRAEVGGDAA